MDRKEFLKVSGLFLLTSYGLPSTVARAIAASTQAKPLSGGRRSKTVVLIFQRGAVDGLSMIPPVGDANYSQAIRPSIAIPTTGDKAALRLDGFFSLHPSLKNLAKFWHDGRMAVIHSVGSPDTTRSHFDAQDYMELGTPGIKNTPDGYLNRALAQFPVSTFRGVALQPTLPQSLRGSSGAFAMNSIQEFSGAGLSRPGMAQSFESLYGTALDQALRGAGQQSFDAMKSLAMLRDLKPSVPYPKGELSKRLSDIAKLIRGNTGVRIAVTDVGGWDTHQRQGASEGQLARRFEDFGDAIAAFVDDLGPLMEDVVLVTQTEFGRTVRENGNGGTDHGHGSAMLVIGNHVQGGKVHARWKGLASAELFEGRDLAVTTDYREVWSEILTRHLGVRTLDEVFPKYRAPDSRLKIFRT